MKAPTTLLFWTGCIVIILFTTIQLFNPGFPAPFFIFIGVGICIWQWFRKGRKMKNLLAEEQRARIAADRYIYERMSSGGQQRKKKR
jgi:hypothetical protein